MQNDLKTSLVLLAVLCIGFTQSTASAPSLVDRMVLSRLDKAVTIDAGQLTLNEVVQSIAKQVNVVIEVDWETLAVPGIKPDAAVWINLKRVAAKQVLQIALDQASADAFADDQAGFAVQDGKINITTLRKHKTVTETRHYNIRKYMTSRPAHVTTEERVDQLVRLIVTYIGDGDEWLDEESTIEEKNAKLKIQTSAKNHAEIVTLFDMIDRPVDQPAGLENKLDRAAEARLNKKISLKEEDMALSDVITSIRDATGLNIAVNWANLELVGVEHDSLVSIKPTNLPADELLRRALEQVAADGEPGYAPNYLIQDGIVHIDTARMLKARTETRVYKLKRWMGRRAENQSAIDEVINAIHQNVGDLDEWLDEESTIDNLNALLIINTTRAQHHEIVALLVKLRR